MKFSTVHYPHDPVSEQVVTAEAADQLGFYGWYLTDSSYRKDLWAILALAAARTEKLRLGPSAIRLLLTDPLVAARSLATLDEISDGRVDAVLGLGDARFPLAQSGADAPKPVPFLRESFDVIRRALVDERIEYDGRFFSYDYRDSPQKARPVQEEIPLWFGSGGGPRLLELSGEISDGAHLAPGWTRKTCDWAAALVRKGAEKAGKDFASLDFAMGPVFVCAEDGDLAREVARIHSTFYLPFQARPYFEAINDTEYDYSRVEEIKAAWLAGDMAKAVSLTPPELAALYYVAGTPQECAEQLKENITDDVNHLVLMVADAGHVEMILGDRRGEIPSVREQMKMISEHVMPEFT
ncbi:MAG: LLM class flavin-dependent oxidoreductase [Actinobacteria bacterium]|nr:LLM class flavin-dependent oxidoreductase [Actinomycetota bacterium]